MEGQIKEIGEIASEEIQVGAIEAYIQKFPENALRFGVKVAMAFIVFVIGVQVIRMVRRIVRRSLKKGNADVGVVQFLDSLIKVLMYIVLLFMIATEFGLDATGAAALLGSAGVAIGLAVQGSLSNFAGGVLILLLKPFRVGDYIKADNDGHEGTVTEIQLFYTKMATPDNHVVIIPNGTLANSCIINMSTLEERKVDILVSISYDADIQAAREALLRVLEDEPMVRKDRERRVLVQSLADSGVQLCVRCWAANADYWESRWRITEQIKYALDNAGIAIPYPQMDVHIDGNVQDDSKKN